MAVAVKTTSGTPTSGMQASPALVSLVGVVYLLACLAIVFKLVPDLWWGAWEGLGWGKSTFVGGTLLLGVVLAIGSLLFVMGMKILGEKPAPGVKAGIVGGFATLVLAVLIARWASLWLEHWAYVTRALSPSTGMIASGIVAGGLLVGWLFLLTRPQTLGWLVALEEGGWFTAAGYKSNQGQRVRRATVLGILVLIGAGIYTLITHNVLARTAPDWSLNVPFTGKVAVQAFGDAESFLAALPPAQKNEVRIVWPGSSSFSVGQKVSFGAYREAVDQALKGTELTAPTETEPTAYLMALGKTIYGPKMSKILQTQMLGQSVTRRLEGLYNQTSYESLGEVMEAFHKETIAANKRDLLDSERNVPGALLLVDQYALRDVNDRTDAKQNVRITLQGDSKFKEGSIVSRKEFDDEVDRIEEIIKVRPGRVLPKMGMLSGATGQPVAMSFTVLPSVQYTVPLLLMAASLWLAWRVVNMPTFADFLIATEAELNKVSWTTQKRLVQDTIVVLVTLVMMAVFLFGMDYTWKVVLSWKPIGILHIPEDDSQKNKSDEQKRW